MLISSISVQDQLDHWEEILNLVFLCDKTNYNYCGLLGSKIQQIHEHLSKLNNSEPRSISIIQLVVFDLFIYMANNFEIFF